MSQTFQEREAEVYADLWSSVALYKCNSPGEHYAPVFHSIVQDPGATVLDVGCGEGRGMVELAKLGYQVAGMDITDEGLSPEAKQYPCVIESAWNDLRPVMAVLRALRPQVFTGHSVDYVYSADVLEHLPTQFTMLAIDQFLRIATKGVFLSIYFDQDRHGHWVGRPLHLTVQPFVWWRDSLREIADVVEARDCLNFGIFYLGAA